MKASMNEKLNAMLGLTRKMIHKVTVCLSALLLLAALTILGLFIAGIRPYVVTTGSMEPAIHVNSVCFVNENTPLDEISVGDVISFRKGENTAVTHRVTAISGSEYTTKGDANNTEDFSTVTAANYIGKIVFVIPGMGSVLNYLHTRRGLITVITLAVFLLILGFLPDKEKKAAVPESIQDD